jgi:hypothetical protein
MLLSFFSSETSLAPSLRPQRVLSQPDMAASRVTGDDPNPASHRMS